MANKKISALTSGSPAQAGDSFPVVRSGSTKKVLVSDVVALVPTVTSTVKGLVPAPPNDATKFLNGIGVFSTPSGGSAFSQIKKTFHDTDILDMQQDGSGGLVILPAVANKLYVPLSCHLKFHYGGVAVFTGTAFDDLFLYQNSQNFIMSGSTKFLFDGGQGNSFLEAMHHGSQATAILGGSDAQVAAGAALWLATSDTPLAGGDAGGNTNTLTVTLTYLTYDYSTGDVS